MDKEKYFNVMKNYKRMCSNLVANISSYNWSDQFCREEIKSLYNKLINEFKGIDFTKFSIDELSTKGITKYLIPSNWAFIITFFKTLR
jgi:hypothetical protein